LDRCNDCRNGTRVGACRGSVALGRDEPCARKFRETAGAVRPVLPDALIRADFVEELLRCAARAVHGPDCGALDGSCRRRERADFRVDAVRTFRAAQSRHRDLLEPRRSFLFGAFRFVFARACRRVRIVASKRERRPKTAHEPGAPSVRPPSQMKWRSDANFSAFRIGRRELVIHRDIASHAAEILQKLGALASASEAGAGNRRSAFRLSLAGGLELFARRGRRGGMIGSILSDVYVGITPRPLNELAVTVEALRRGIQVAEPMGAMIEWIGPALYRGFFLTRAVRAMTLWEFLRTDDDPIVRSHVLGQARAAIDAMHDKGLF